MRERDASNKCQVGSSVWPIKISQTVETRCDVASATREGTLRPYQCQVVGGAWLSLDDKRYRGEECAYLSR